MPYEIPATAEQPAFIIYLIDLSASMNEKCTSELTRIEVVKNALERTRRTMIARSRRGDQVRPRYAVSMIGYNHQAVDLLGGVKNIDELETMALPSLIPAGRTNTAAAFEVASQFLQHFLPGIQDCPAPLVCHLTDGEVNEGQDIEPICSAIKAMSNQDGNVLIENIYIGTQLLHAPITSVKDWQGVANPTEIREPHVQTLWHMASPLPESYARMMTETEGYGMLPGAKMLIPAETPKMIELAFAVSGSTPIR